jgi:hypothetical protein
MKVYDGVYNINMGQPKLKKIATEKFFTFALVIGFVVDTITLISILLSLRLNNGIFVLPTFINHWLAFSVWVLGFYLYLALLHSYWQKNVVSKNFQQTLGGFLIRNLILEFCSPFLSLLGLVSLITLVWIASFEQGIATVLIVILVFGGYITFITFFVKGMTSTHEVKIDDDLKQKIDGNWEFVKKRIKNKLSRKQWISFLDLEDIAILWNIDVDDMVYALAKYASENPTGTTLGKIHLREDGETISGDCSVLVNIKNFNHEKYYYTG